MASVEDIQKLNERIKSLKPVQFRGLCDFSSQYLNEMFGILSSVDPSEIDPQILTQLYDPFLHISELFTKFADKNWAAENYDIPVEQTINDLMQTMDRVVQVSQRPFSPSNQLFIDDLQSLIGLYASSPALCKDPRFQNKVTEIATTMENYSQLQDEGDDTPNEGQFSGIQRYKLSKSDYEKSDEKPIEKGDIQFYRGILRSTQEPVTIISMGEENRDKFNRIVELLMPMKHQGLETFIGESSESLPLEIVTLRKGDELSNVIKRGGQDDDDADDDKIAFKPGDRTMIAFKIAQAAAFLHSHRIIHRDLNTTNILIEKNKNPKIINFANSRYMPDDPVTVTSILSNTSPFLAPEILLHAETYDDSVDVFAFAGILYELLTGKPPFGNSKKTGKQICDGKRPPLKNCSDDLKELIEACWNEEPTKRPSFPDIIDRMISKRICFPSDEDSDELKQFYDSNTIKNTAFQTCLQSFNKVFEAISHVFVYEREFIRARSILQSYYLALLNNRLAREDGKIDYLIEGHLYSINDALDGFLNLCQNAEQDRWGTIALSVQAPLFSTQMRDKMEEIYIAMIEIGNNDLPRYHFVNCDISPDFEYIYSVFSDYKEQYPEAGQRMEEIEQFLQQLGITVEATQNAVDDSSIRQAISQFKKYEVPRSNYKISNELGSGLTSTVYLAKDKQNNAKVAIKEFHDDYLQGEDASLRLKREITFLVTLSHQYIVSFIGFNADPGQPLWVISEYMPNGDLFKANIKKKLNGFQKTTIMFNIAEGMEYLHDMHVLHRDLKTANILLQGDTPKITDFGFAKANLNLSNTGRVGTLNYMAPEVFNSTDYDYPADVCSFSRMLWELYDGRFPWSWIKHNSMLQDIIQTGSQPLPFSKPISQELKSLIEDGCQIDPKQRPSFTEILNRMIAQKIAFPDADPAKIEQFYAEKAAERSSQ